MPHPVIPSGMSRFAPRIGTRSRGICSFRGAAALARSINRHRPRGFTGCGKTRLRACFGKGTSLLVPICPLLLSFRGGFSRRGICFPGFFRSLFSQCRKTFSNTVIPSEASCFTVKHDAKSRDLLIRLWQSRGDRMNDWQWLQLKLRLRAA